jgi:methylthioribulose-1-phosphate dehydratase
LRDGKSQFVAVARDLARLAREFHARGWALGSSGNLSVVVGRVPLRLAITASGLDKSQLEPRHVVLVGGDGGLLRGARHPSAETRLHLAIIHARSRAAGAVLHTHSVWSTILSERHAAGGGIAIEGFEMLKGLAGVQTHQHREWLPIVENSQNYTELAAALEQSLRLYPRCHAVLLRQHGLYTWGENLVEAKRHLEIFEFLLEVMGRMAAEAPHSKAASA